MLLGINFSHHQSNWLKLDPQKSLENICTWPIEVIRLGAYWNEIESQPSEFNFSVLKEQLEICRQAEKKVVLSLGSKAPRWPEFYFPDHVQPDYSLEITQKKLLIFIKKTIETVDPFKIVTHWQIENEPLDPSGPTQQVIPIELVKQEIKIAQQLSDLPIIINLWGNDLSSRGNIKQAAQLADIVGIDIYYKQFLSQILKKTIYSGPRDSQEKLQKIIFKCQKPVWIMELQAEPWEKNDQAYRSQNPGSFNLAKLQKNWELAKQLPVEAIFFWGAEYWL